ncbi:bifunctional uridylyltransferase/uridylyl-removing enzyme [Psychrosphaera saromensis]|nr:[protein-PII] uridylyltransferase [Psychrosphaera saromensis]GHB63415.1 bifunctional uridylyltransferase/uridylyl-removing enzyme [Psychrosphaera saromensis]GLQ15567.1 bifunctional uridylyltransferase/uridylyl-removing enzyme [Psychrosphaera saromensis]
MIFEIPAPMLTPLPKPFNLVEYKERIKQFSDWSEQNFNSIPVRYLVKARAEFVDFILRNVWTYTGLDEDNNLSLVAVGGYGRKELHPQSDVDLLLLSKKSISSSSTEKISLFITTLWDLKFDVGHSVRTIKETLSIAKDDITIATNLMERRPLAGNNDIFKVLCDELTNSKFITSKEFYLAKREEQVQRHNRYHSTSYNLEPNLKANPGCLRDLQTISWVAKKHFDTQSVAELVKHGYLQQDEYQEMEECQDYLWQMRFALHVVAKRSENRLLFDYQPEVAEMMGFGDDGKAAVERMMKRFFRVARRVVELNTMLLQVFNSAILGITREVTDIDNDFAIHGRSLLAKHDDVFFNRANMIKMFTHIAEHDEIEKLHSSTIRLLRQVRRRLMGDLQDLAYCREALLEFFRHPNSMGKAFTLMLRHSVLAYYMPNWRHIVGQMQFDLFHAYTVDEHTHRLIQNLHRFTIPEYKSEFPLCSGIMKRLDKPELLYMAGIFHDIGKGRGGDHSKLGAIDATSFGELHKLPKSDTKIISWLVDNHLLMSVTAQKSDIYNPDVIAKFAKIVKDENRLDLLYCLTVADVRATNTNLWNDWKSTLLADLYLVTQRALRQGLENAKDMRETAKANKEQALVLLEKNGHYADHVQKIWKQIRTLYFARHAPKHIEWHTEKLLAHSNRSKRPLVLISETAVRGGTQVFVYAKDQPGLFADIVTTFDTKNANVVDAHILNTKDGYVIDTFIILEQDGSLISTAERREDIRVLVENVILTGKCSSTFSKRIPRQIKQFKIPVTVNFKEDSNKYSNMMELTALDTPGVLAKISKVFKQNNIMLYSAKISTIGEKAEDIFRVSTIERTKLNDEQKASLVEALKLELELD